MFANFRVFSIAVFTLFDTMSRVRMWHMFRVGGTPAFVLIHSEAEGIIINWVRIM